MQMQCFWQVNSLLHDKRAGDCHSECLIDANLHSFGGLNNYRFLSGVCDLDETSRPLPFVCNKHSTYAK